MPVRRWRSVVPGCVPPHPRTEIPLPLSSPAEMRRNTQNVNVKTATKESHERWVKNVLASIETLQMKASKALFVFQRQPDKDGLFISANQLHAELSK